MMRLKVQFRMNQGRRGVPMSKLGKISEQAEKFLRFLAADCQINAQPGEWLATNFENGSVVYDAEFQGNVSAGAAQHFARNLELLADFDPETEGLNADIRPSTVLEYARIGTLIDPDEMIGLGIYPVFGGRPKLRNITYHNAVKLRRVVEEPLPAYGSVQGIIHAWFKEAREPYFQIRELTTDALIRILYPASMYSDVARAVQERTTMLMVAGNTLLDRANESAIQICADRIERMEMLSNEDFERFFGSTPEFEVADEAELDG